MAISTTGRRQAKAAGGASIVTTKTGKPQVAEPRRLFPSQETWRGWLEKNHRQSGGLWLRLAKKGSGLRSVSHSEALEIALCYGWIDGQKKAESEQAWLQRFLPRSTRSVWSKINREKALALIGKGRMMAAGLEAIEAAKKNGSWESAYDSPNAAEVPEDLQAALDVNPRAREFFESLDRANRYAVLFRIQTVKKPPRGPPRFVNSWKCSQGKKDFTSFVSHAGRPDNAGNSACLTEIMTPKNGGTGDRFPARQQHQSSSKLKFCFSYLVMCAIQLPKWN